jgi:hypothetical protein
LASKEAAMSLTGRCYCGAVKYEADGPVAFRGQCHCRECQYITGGAENLFMGLPVGSFRYTEGQPKSFKRTDIENAGTREFCPECGTHLTTLPGRRSDVLILKVGTLDDPKAFEGPQMVIWTADAQPYHLMPQGVPQFPGFPG